MGFFFSRKKTLTDLCGQHFSHGFRRRFEGGSRDHKEEGAVLRVRQPQDLQGVVTADEDKAAQECGPHVVCVIPAHPGLGSEAGNNEVLFGERGTEESIHLRMREEEGA